MPNTAGVTNYGDPKRTVVAVNGNGGGYVLISASIFTGYVEVAECPPVGGGAFAPQGLTYQLADENYANTYGLITGDTWAEGDSIQKNRSIGVPQMTMADRSVRPATPWIKVRSATATPTQVEVREWRQRLREINQPTVNSDLRGDAQQ